MCKTCDKEVIDMDIRESDLPNLPFTPVLWYCMVEGCNCKAKLRDYGIAPLYWWPVKITRKDVNTFQWETDDKGKQVWRGGRIEHIWRGGWTSALHGYVCSRHWKEAKQQGWHTWAKQHITTNEALLAKIKPITKAKKKTRWENLK